MSSLEGNKTLAAVLTAGIMAVGAAVFSEIVYAPHMPEEMAYAVELPEADGAAPAEAVEATPLPVLLASADAAAGQGVAKKCASCHSFEEGGGNKVGPELWGVVGRDKGSAPGFGYSEALASAEGAWTYESLNGFLTSPKSYAPGTSMSFAGISKEGDRADLIAYLRSVSPDAPPLPAVEEASEADPAESDAAGAGDAAGTDAAAVDEAAEEVADAVETAEDSATETVAAVEDAGGDAAAEVVDEAAETAAVAVAAVAGDADAGKKTVRRCAACHNFEEGAGHKVGPELWGVFGRDIAAADGFGYSDALAGKDGVWDAASLDAFLTNPKEWAPGTKMAFAGLRKEGDRANVIAYLQSLSN